jgi:hypothetical protein
MLRPIISRTPTMKAKLLVLFCSLLAAGAVTVSAHRWLRATPANATPVLASQPKQEEQEKAKVILFTIRPTGFEPAEATIPAGKYFVVIQNRSGLKELTLRLDTEVGGRLLEVSMPKGKLDWRRWLDLTPGDYTLTEANNPEWVCHVKITP